MLGAIVGYAGLLGQALQPSDRRQRYVEQVQRAAARAAALTRQLLAFSRKQILEPKVFSLNVLVSEVRPMLERLIGEDVRIEGSLRPDLAFVKADPAQVEQVLLNLVVNARDAMPEGGVLTIETANVELDESYCREHPGASPGNFAMLAVSDTGHGIGPDVLPHVFEPFFTTKGPGKGTGLGLSTVYGIVKQSGGYVMAYSEPGSGSTFKVYLPQVPPPTEMAAPSLPAAPLPVGSESVLVVEDEGALREVVGEILRGAGYRVLSAATREDALVFAEPDAVSLDLLITDVVLPGMNGRELAARLAARRPSLRVLYMSGYAQDAIVRNGALEPGLAFIGKPFGHDALRRKVREVLDRPRGLLS
jgi:CheY-like chemotaxis protein